MKITVVGLGYVGISNAVLLAQRHEVTALDIDQDRVDLINNKISPVDDNDVEIFLKQKELDLTAVTDATIAFSSADYVVVATPTDYDTSTNRFNTETVESVIAQVTAVNPRSIIVIRSTIPIGFTDRVRKKFENQNIFFAPEFLREGQALHDNLYPSRIIIGGKGEAAKLFASFLREGSQKRDVEILHTDTREAEAVKLFSNTYLAMRVAFFNELDSYALSFGLDSGQIVNGVSLDPRISNKYNNPSFGYGGYCLPKDSKQLLSNFGNVPQNLIQAIVSSNETRAEYLVREILQKKPSVIGIHRLQMKKLSDNFRDAAISKIVDKLKMHDVEIVLYEPTIQDIYFNDCLIMNDFEKFKKYSDLIITNRNFSGLKDVADKVFTRDLFGRD